MFDLGPTGVGTMALKRIRPKIHSQSLGAVRMWRDDLQELFDVIEEAVHPESLEITVDDYILDSIDDLGEIQSERIGSFVIESENRTVRLDLGKFPCLISVKNPDLKINGMLDQVVKKARSCSRAKLFHWMMGTHLSRRTSRAIAGTLTAGGVALVIAGLIDKESRQESLAFSDFIPFLSTAVTLAAFTLLSQPFTSVIKPRTRLEAPTFWHRKKDDIALTLTSNFASAIAGGFIGYWVNTLN